MLPPVVLFLALLPLSIVGLEVLLKGFILAEGSVESILDVVIYSSWHVLLNLNPFVSKHLVELHQLKIFGDGPLFFVEVWIDIVVPSLSALLADSSRKKCGNLLPFFEAVLRNLLFKDHILFRSPVAFNLLDCTVLSIISQNEPSVHTFHL